jgi:hypothetical protein
MDLSNKDISMNDRSITIWESYVGKGAPSNRAGARRGYGLTKETAHRNAGHWANQAAWAKARRVTISDHDRPPSMTTREEKIAWDICGIPGEFVPPTKLEKECAALIRQGKYASAVLKALTE